MENEKETICLGSDHAGFALKEYVKSLLQSMGYPFEDMGAFSEERVDYPDFGEKVALKVKDTPGTLGIISCATGIGISIAANKIKGIRAALACDEQSARLSRQHNNANILALAGRPFDREKVEQIVKAFLSARFEGGRHAARLEKLIRIEEQNL